MRKLFCDNCQKELDFVYVDGYGFGEAIMDGVVYKVKNTNGKPECIGFEEMYKGYMIQFNWQYWKEMCEAYCKNLDIAACPNCEDDVIVND